MAKKKLGDVLKEARKELGLSLREVERETDISNAHLSQVESGKIEKPDMALLYTLATLYRLDYRELLALAGYGVAERGSGRERQRMSVAMRAMGELSAKEQNEVLGFMSEIRKRRDA
jgi:HTH-type transcriptional regulator, competence development regulator